MQPPEAATEPLRASVTSDAVGESPSANDSVADPATPSASATPQTDLNNFGELVTLVQSMDEGKIRQEIGLHLRKLEAQHAMADYTVLYLMETSQSIAAHHANTIYDAAAGQKGKPSRPSELH